MFLPQPTAKTGLSFLDYFPQHTVGIAPLRTLCLTGRGKFNKLLKYGSTTSIKTLVLEA